MSTTRKIADAELPYGWRMVALRDVLILDQPGAWGDDPTPDDPGVQVLRAADLTRDGKLSVVSAAWRRFTTRDRERRLMKDGDLILERSGGGPGTPVGRVALIKDLGTIYCNNFCQQLRVDDQQCNPRYAARALWHRYVQGVTSRLEHQTTGIRNLDYTGYLNHPIILPPLPEQRAIADVLDSIDEAIERTDAVIAATETLRDALLQELVTRGLPGWHTEWKDVPGVGTIPADWEVVRLRDVCERITKGTTPTTLGYSYTPNGVRFLRVENVNGGRVAEGQIKFISPDTHQMLARSVLQEGDVLMSIAGALGRSALVTSELLPANVNQALAIIRLDQSGRANPEFIALCLQGSGIQGQVEDMRAELAQANINLEQVGSLRVPLPPSTERKTIAGLLSEVDTTIAEAKREQDGLRSLKESTADALLTGEARINN